MVANLHPANFISISHKVLRNTITFAVRGMTTIRAVKLFCPECRTEFVGIYHPSICTWLDPDAIQEMYDRGYAITCTECNFKVLIKTTVIINAPSNMWTFDTGQDLATTRHFLEDIGLIDDNGKVVPIEVQVAQVRARLKREEEEKHKYKGTLDSLE